VLSVLLSSCFLSCEVPKAESFLNQEPYQLELHHCLDYTFKSETERAPAVLMRSASVYAADLIRLVNEVIKPSCKQFFNADTPNGQTLIFFRPTYDRWFTCLELDLN
jgi:hypothetical protein